MCELINIPISRVFIFFLIFFFNVYLFLGQRETEHERGRGRERGRYRIGKRLQALSHQPRARRGARTNGPRDRDLAEVGRLTDCATQAPLISLCLNSICFQPIIYNIECSFLYIGNYFNFVISDFSSKLHSVIQFSILLI